MAIFKALTFDGVNSLDYGIYITGEAVYNAPERAVEMVNIPGKNGALALDQGRFENIEITYHAGCFADSQADFADKVTKFRNALASRYTYKRLTDEYHPDEYRLGLYKSGLEVDAVRYGTAGEFNIVFDCKPQRFLVDGDRVISPTEWSDVQTVTGELVTIESDGSLAVKSLEVSLEPIQAGSGTPSPTNIRPISGRTEVVTYRTDEQLYIPSNTKIGKNWIMSADPKRAINIFAVEPNTRYRVITEGGNFSVILFIRMDNFTQITSIGINPPFNGYITTESNCNKVIVQFQKDTAITESDFDDFECSISKEYESHTATFGETVYGGTLDVVSGELVVDRAMVDLGTLEYNYDSTVPRFYSYGINALVKAPLNNIAINAISSDYIATSFDNLYMADKKNGTFAVGATGILSIINTSYTDATAFKTAMSGVQLCYELATPQTYQLTPQQIDLLLGTNHLWSDGEITVEYGVHPYYNPTPFESKPLIKVTGTGTLGIGEYILTITGTASQTLYIDCETMEIYTLEGTVPTGASSLVSINKNDFPVLEPGTNNISVGSGITAVTITPRWWRI